MITEYKHRMKVQPFINLQLHVFQKLDKLFYLVLNVNTLRTLTDFFLLVLLILQG